MAERISMSARREVVSAVTERFLLVEPNADPIGHHPLSERLRHVAIFVCMGKIKIELRGAHSENPI